jgi:WD40 repeat protein
MDLAIILKSRQYDPLSHSSRRLLQPSHTVAHFWNLQTVTEEKTVTVAVNLLAMRNFLFSPDGRLLITISSVITSPDDGVVQLWDMGTGDLLRTFC